LKHGQGGEIGGFAEQAKRPPKLKGRIANDVGQFGARSAVMPPPQGDTKQPYTSKAHVTTSPSNFLSKGKGQSIGSMRPQSGLPKGHVSKTPKPSRG
jgi:hypothetical protein